MPSRDVVIKPLAVDALFVLVVEVADGHYGAARFQLDGLSGFEIHDRGDSFCRRAAVAWSSNF